MNDDERLLVLLDDWQEAQARGEVVTPQDLCRDSPALLPDLERRIGVLRRFDAVRAPADTLLDSRPPGEPAPRPAVGEQFGDYHVVALLGSGGMGRVYRATDRALRREVALKVVRPEVAAAPQARERFLREARA